MEVTTMTGASMPRSEAVPEISRLHALDTEFLLLEDADSPMCIGGLCVFDGPVPSREECERFVFSRLDALPTHRKRVRTVPFGLGRPVLIDDVHFDIRYHVRRTRLADPYSEAALHGLMAEIMSRPLDRQRPLWQLYVVEGLPDQRWALITKIHHAIVDGIAGIGVLAAVLSMTNEVQAIEEHVWRPAREPTGFELVADALRGLRHDAVLWAKDARIAAHQPQIPLRHARGIARGMFLYVRHALDRRTSSLQGRVHGSRRYTTLFVPLDDVRRVRDAHGCTVNDVILALLSGGYRAVLEDRGDDLGKVQLRSLVPASVRLTDIHDVSGNRISAMYCELPVSLESAPARLELIAQRMKEAKASHMIEAGAWFTEIVDLAPPLLVGAVSRLIVRGMHWLPQNMLTTVTTNVAGPSCPLYFRGRRMLTWSPYVPITQGARMGSAVLSYQGSLAFGITADHDSVTQLDAFARAIQADLEALLAGALPLQTGAQP
jgi:diacylglycerol O-acyltransferase / wax synthase